MQLPKKIKAATLYAICLSTFAPGANAGGLVTPVYCNYQGGTSGLPSGAFDEWVNVSQSLCLHFGETTTQTAPYGATIGGRLDGVAGQTFSNLTFNCKRYTTASITGLYVHGYFITTTGKKVFAYALGNAPSTKTTLANGDVRLTFTPNAFTSIPYGTSLTGSKISALEIDTQDYKNYSPNAYYLYGFLLNNAALSPNLKSGGPFSDCTF